MKKKSIISIILFSMLTSYSQLNHIIEIGGGISGSAHVKSVANSSFNLDYILNYKVFLFKASYGFSPRTDFGVRTGASLTIGFTSPIEKVFSFHFIYGIGKTWVSKNIYIAEFDNAGNPIPNQTYHYKNAPFNPIISAGFFIKPFKSYNILFGFDASVSQETTETESYTSGPPYNYHFPGKQTLSSFSTFNLIIAYNFNREKK